MKKRGIVFILMSIPAWVFNGYFIHEAYKTPFGYELGSVAYPLPPLVRVKLALAMLFTIVGISFFIFDLIKCVHKKSNGSKS
jgi:hypothetical protein